VGGRFPEELRAKVVAVTGDITQPKLDISQDDALRLSAEVEFIIHSAASISFFEHIHALLEQNYKARLRACFCPPCYLGRPCQLQFPDLGIGLRNTGCVVSL
jgi:hypothetical protein